MTSSQTRLVGDETSMLGDSTRALMRWVPAVLAMAVAGYVIGSFVVPAATDAKATTVLLLTNEVNYPYYDATLARQPGYIEDEAFVSEVQLAAGTPEARLSAEASPDISVSTFTVTATASSAADALAAANTAGDLLVIRNRKDVMAVIEQDIAALDDAIDSQQQRVDELTAASAEAAREFADWQAKSNDSSEPGYADALTQRLIADTAASNADRQAWDAQVDLDRIVSDQTDLTTDLSLVNGEVEIASAAKLESSSKRLPTNLILAAAMGLLGLLFVPSLERRFGKVRSTTSFTQLWPSVPVVDSSQQSKLVTNIPVAWKRSRQNAGGSATFLGFPDDRIAKSFVSVAGGLDDMYDSVTVLGADTEADQATELWGSDLFIVVDSSRTTMHGLSALHAELGTLGLVPQTVILHGE